MVFNKGINLSNNWKELLIPLVKKAGEAVKEIYDSGDVQADIKSDKSPITAADLAANKIILEGLKETGIPILSEESKEIPYSERKDWTKLWLVDPLDGTKEFISRNGEFTVNIALVENGKPTVGVVNAPALDITYYGDEKEALKIEGEQVKQITTAKISENQQLRVVASRSHLNEETKKFLEQLKNYSLVSGGSSLKFCRIAEGAADLYPRLAPTMEWDTAAAQAVLEAAGGIVQNVQGEPLQYSKQNLLNPSFIAAGDQEYLKKIKEVMQ